MISCNCNRIWASNNRCITQNVRLSNPMRVAGMNVLIKNFKPYLRSYFAFLWTRSYIRGSWDTYVEFFLDIPQDQRVPACPDQVLKRLPLDIADCVQVGTVNILKHILHNHMVSRVCFRITQFEHYSKCIHVYRLHTGRLLQSEGKRINEEFQRFLHFVYFFRVHNVSVFQVNIHIRKRACHRMITGP